MKLLQFLPALLLLLGPQMLWAQSEPPLEPLWPDGSEDGAFVEEVDRPTLQVYLPDASEATGTAVVVCPGGGYVNLAVDHEGRQIAEWLNTLGVAAFVLRYRRGEGYGHPIPLMDAQRAIQTVRSRAEGYGLKPDQIGILGFSAGGHLTASAGTHYKDGDPDADEPLLRVSSRPDFMILGYPVITMHPSFTHGGSRQHLIGKDATADMTWLMSNEKQVTPETPPAFLVHTTDDQAVPVENSLAMYKALRDAGVPVEMHIYESGRHGLGMAPDDISMSAWPEAAANWMRKRGWVGGKK